MALRCEGKENVSMVQTMPISAKIHSSAFLQIRKTFLTIDWDCYNSSYTYVFHEPPPVLVLCMKASGMGKFLPPQPAAAARCPKGGSPACTPSPAVRYEHYLYSLEYATIDCSILTAGTFYNVKTLRFKCQFCTVPVGGQKCSPLPILA